MEARMKRKRNQPIMLGPLLDSLPAMRDLHAPGTPPYELLKTIARMDAETLFASADPRPVPFGAFGKILLPYFKMGAIDSINLFDIDELILFAFYWANRGRYRKALDIGANIGLHSILMSKAGFEVTAFEPDPTHFEVLRKNLELNECRGVTPINAAVSDRAGTAEFVRVLGNTTGSHLAGSKSNPYGELERFEVRTESILPRLPGVDLVKIDAEGHEKQILLATSAEHWRRADLICEISSAGNAEAVHRHLTSLGLNLFAQKIGWRKVTGVNDMPVSHHEGSLYAGRKPRMTWSEKDDAGW